MTCSEALLSSVYPSAGAFATIAEPTMPLAPGLLSTKMLCFSMSPIATATTRPTRSVGPPGG